MILALRLAAIAVTVIIVARLSAPFGPPAPIALLVVGLIASVLPFVPDVSLDPDVVLLGLLPLVLYATALNTSLVVLGLSVGLIAAMLVPRRPSSRALRSPGPDSANPQPLVKRQPQVVGTVNYSSPFRHAQLWCAAPPTANLTGVR